MTDTDPTTTLPATGPLHDLRATIEERRATGQAARMQASRSAQAHWDETARGHDALDTILAQNAIRVPELLPIRHGRMVASPWTYYRGAAAVMAADLASRPHSGLRVQLCGDAHVLNFGLWATPERNLPTFRALVQTIAEIESADFSETPIIRLRTSTIYHTALCRL